MPQNPLNCIATLLLGACIFASCSRDTNPIPETDPPVLLKVYEIDSTLAAPYDTISRIALSYDASGRVIVSSRLEFYNVGDSLTLDTLRYFYNSPDTLASRSIYTAVYTNSTRQKWIDTTDYTYSAARLIGDTTYGTRSNSANNNYITRRISYSPDSIIVLNNISPRWMGTTQVFNMRHKFVITASGTTFNQVDTIISYPNALVHLEIWRESDNMILLPVPDPLYARSKPVSQPFTDHYFSPHVMIQPRDMPLLLLQRERGHHMLHPNPSPASVRTESWVYHLRPDGYPSVAWRTSITGTLGPKRIKRLYIYQ